MSEFESAEFASPDNPRPEREGLPRSYRMRADAHYVESLSAPARDARETRDSRDARDGRDTREARARDGARAGAADATAAPVDRRIFDQIAEDVASIESAAAMLAADPSPLSRRVGLELIRAQSARASWLVRARALVSGTADPDVMPRWTPVDQILRDVRDRSLAECRLAGVRLELEPVESPVPAIAADPAIAIGLTGAIVALLGVVSGSDGAAIALRAVAAGEHVIALEVSEDAATLPASLQARFFDVNWAARPGGWLAGLGAATVKAAAERLGGRVSIGPGDGRGSVIRWTLTASPETTQ